MLTNEEPKGLQMKEYQNRRRLARNVSGFQSFVVELDKIFIAK